MRRDAIRAEAIATADFPDPVGMHKTTKRLVESSMRLTASSCAPRQAGKVEGSPNDGGVGKSAGTRRECAGGWMTAAEKLRRD